MAAVKFDVFPNMGNLKGVFTGRYSMHGPFKDKDLAKAFADSRKAVEAHYVESNQILYILVPSVAQEEIKNDNTAVEETLPGQSKVDSVEVPRTLPSLYPHPKPEPAKPARNWFKKS